MKKKIFLFAFFLLLLSCATYYQRTYHFQETFGSGSFEKADAILEKDKKGPRDKNKVLYFLNRGLVKYMLGENQESIKLFMEAEKYIEDQQKNYTKDALSLVSNSEIKPYKPEDFESIMVNFYLIMNFLDLGKYDAAIVESKRINIKLHQLNDRYKDHKNKYQRDAFAHNLMGIIYDANKDYNNAFIAYRNAYEVYEKDYVKLFGLSAPKQLKKDLLRAAYRTGFYDEVDYYEQKFSLKYSPKKDNEGELVFFWLNGLGPVKEEWDINFAILPKSNGWVTFVNTDLGIVFPFFIGNKSSKERNALLGMQMVRIAFPKYVERKPLYNSAKLILNDKSYSLEITQNINAIAFRSLKDRMTREIGSTLLRFATKKALEATAENQVKGFGTLLSIANAITEKADTRNWQTLPHTISYIRVPLNLGVNTIKLEAYRDGQVDQIHTLNLNVSKGETLFKCFHNLETLH